MTTLDGRVAIVTGAGRGLGRDHALLLAAEGASVVVNDIGSETNGDGSDQSVAQAVANEISAAGGQAIANTDSITTLDGAGRLVKSALDTFGHLDILVNNAGILRDRMLVNMSESDFDAVINVHVKGTFCPMQQAALHWRERAKAGEVPKASIINTSSTSGLFNRVGQLNYGAAKSAIATMTMIGAKELERYGVRVNAIAPVARTRLTIQTPGFEDRFTAPSSSDVFDEWDPANVSPLVAYLASESCPFTGGVFRVSGGDIGIYTGWTLTNEISKQGRWSVSELEAQGTKLLNGRREDDGLISEGSRTVQHSPRK